MFYCSSIRNHATKPAAVIKIRLVVSRLFWFLLPSFWMDATFLFFFNTRLQFNPVNSRWLIANSWFHINQSLSTTWKFFGFLSTRQKGLSCHVVPSVQNKVLYDYFICSHKVDIPVVLQTGEKYEFACFHSWLQSELLLWSSVFYLGDVKCLSCLLV